MCFLLFLKKNYSGYISEMIYVRSKKASQTPEAFWLSFRWPKTDCRMIPRLLELWFWMVLVKAEVANGPRSYAGSQSFAWLLLSVHWSPYVGLAVFVALIRLQVLEELDTIPASQTSFTWQQEKAVVILNSWQHTEVLTLSCWIIIPT